MTGTPHHYPPPGAPLPEEPAGAGSGRPPAARGPGRRHRRRSPRRTPLPLPGMLGAAHKPGAIPLRPLTLGNIYDGAFRIIRFNPKATVGAAALVTAVAMILPIAISTVLAFTVGSGIEADGEFDEDASTARAAGAARLARIAGPRDCYAAQLGVIFVTGMIAHVTHAAAVGRRLTLAEAWAATHGKRWRLLGQTAAGRRGQPVARSRSWSRWSCSSRSLTGDVLATVLLGIVLSPASIPLFVWLWIKVVFLATPALMLEPIGVFGSFGRNWRLTTDQFWRILGIGLLTS